jgi:hypothetical protein
MTNTFHDGWIERYVAGVLTSLGILVIMLLMGACASIQRDPSYEEEAPRCTEICWVMTVRNDNYSEARVYINGQRAATLPGMMRRAVGIPIRRSMLDGAGCMEVFVKLYSDTKTASSSKACPIPGSQLQLAIEESYGGHPLNLWLQDWRKR